jgi:hypothetical protein
MIPLPFDFDPLLAAVDLARADELLRPDVEAPFVVPAFVDLEPAFLALDDDFDFAVPFVELALTAPDDLLPVRFFADDELFADELLAAVPVFFLVDDFDLELDDFDAADFEPDDREVEDFEAEAFFVVGIW